MFNYRNAFKENIERVKAEGRYRTFANVMRNTETFPEALLFDPVSPKKITIWCSNDYLGQGCNPAVLKIMAQSIQTTGAGAGGTRNISGNSRYHKLLESELANFHHKEAALLFTSGYAANETALSTIAKALPQCIIFSDQKNHASLIAGIRNSGAKKHIFAHNDVAHLEELLRQYPLHQPKLIVFESVYSMDGDFGRIEDIVKLAKAYGALTYLDEVHAVGMYGTQGAGLAEVYNLRKDIDIIQGTLGKAIGCIGGYIASGAELIDVVRCNAPGFIFTTSLPPFVAAGAVKSLQILRSSRGHTLRQQHQERAQYLKNLLRQKRLPFIEGPSHIIPLMVNNAVLCRKLSLSLLEEFQIYIQPINYPTVERGKERLRITPTPFHDNSKMHKLVDSLDELWTRFDLPRSGG